MLSRLSSISSPLASFLPSLLRQPIVQKLAPASFSTSAALEFNSRLTSPHNFPQPRRQVSCFSFYLVQENQSSKTVAVGDMFSNKQWHVSGT